VDFNENISNLEAIKSIKREEIPVIIFGAGIVAEVLFHACRSAGIMVECFCDNNFHKTLSPKCNIEVVHTSNLKKKYKDANIIISAADMKDVVEQLRLLGYSKWHAGNLLLRDFDVSRYQFSAPEEFVGFAIGACILCHDSYLNPDKLFLRSVDIIITERCSLKCRDCSNLMQYYEKPKDCDIEEIIQSIDVLCAYVDEVHEFRVIGGEPFMNKEINLIIKRLIDESKIKKIAIYTNGTIIPKESQVEFLKNSKVILFITDYGRLSRKRDALIQMLQRHKINFYLQKGQGWTDCSDIKKHNRNAEEQGEIFNSCCAKNTVTLSNGELHRCPFSANAARLSAVPDVEDDYINISEETHKATDNHEMKKKIRAFLLEKKFLETCDYCNGRTFGAPEIPAAVQTDKPLEYVRYSTIKQMS